MRTMHIAFLIFPHTPHVHPTLSIVSTLVRRGHRVTYVTSDAFSSKVSALGAQVVPCPRFIDFSADGKPRFRNTFALSDAVISELAHLDDAPAPDLVVYDRAFFAGRVLASRWRAPAITTTPGLAFNKADVSQLSAALKAWRDVEIRYTREVDAFLEGHGIREVNAYFHEEQLNIYLYPKLYQLSGDVFGESYFYAGRCAAERPYHGAWRSADTGGRPVVLVSASTAYVPGPDYFKTCIEALSGSRWHVLLALTGNIDPAALGPLPPHFEVVTQAGQIQILPNVDLLICMGGPVSAAEAMYHGVPLLMTTHGSQDAEVYAENAARLGIGIHLRKEETTAETIRDAASRILDDSEFATRMTEIQRLVQREAGAEEAANRIEDHLRKVAC